MKRISFLFLCVLLLAGPAWAGAVYVGNSGSSPAGVGNAVSTSSALSVGAGDLIVCFVGWGNPSASVTGVGDGAGNVLARIGGSTGTQLDAWYKENATGNPTAVLTAVLSATTGGRSIICHQYANAEISGALQGSSFTSGTGTEPFDAVAPAVSTSVPGVVVGAVTLNNGGQAVVPNPPYLARAALTGNSTSTEDLVGAAAGTYMASFHVSGTISVSYGVATVAFKDAVSAPALATRLPLLGVRPAPTTFFQCKTAGCSNGIRVCDQAPAPSCVDFYEGDTQISIVPITRDISGAVFTATAVKAILSMVFVP